MTIATHRRYEDPTTCSVAGLITSAVDGASMSIHGAVESLTYEHRHLTKSFAHLVETLAAKGLLTAPEVVKIACHYDADPEATFA